MEETIRAPSTKDNILEAFYTLMNYDPSGSRAEKVASVSNALLPMGKMKGMESLFAIMLGSRGWNTVGPTLFRKIISKNKSPTVHVYKKSEYNDIKKQGGQLVLNKDRSAGVAIKRDGEIVSVFSNKPGKGLGQRAVKEAVDRGGHKLDAFDSLENFYKKSGFKTTGKDKWNPMFKPDRWDQHIQRVGGNPTPDIVYMAREPITQVGKLFRGTKR